MVLLLVCVCVYLFVLQGTIELPGVEKMLKENVKVGDLNVNLPAYQTASPSPEPTRHASARGAAQRAHGA